MKIDLIWFGAKILIIEAVLNARPLFLAATKLQFPITKRLAIFVDPARYLYSSGRAGSIKLVAIIAADTAGKIVIVASDTSYGY